MKNMWGGQTPTLEAMFNHSCMNAHPVALARRTDCELDDISGFLRFSPPGIRAPTCKVTKQFGKQYARISVDAFKGLPL
jgi:hypothetical protein